MNPDDWTHSLPERWFAWWPVRLLDSERWCWLRPVWRWRTYPPVAWAGEAGGPVDAYSAEILPMFKSPDEQTHPEPPVWEPDASRVVLWHPESPGMRVRIDAGRLRRWGLRRSAFATTSEVYAAYAAAIARAKRGNGCDDGCAWCGATESSREGESMTESAYVVLHERTRRDTEVVGVYVALDAEAARAAAIVSAERHALSMDAVRTNPTPPLSPRRWQLLSNAGGQWERFGDTGGDEWWAVYRLDLTRIGPDPTVRRPALGRVRPRAW